MFDKIAAALSVVALGAAGFAVYKTGQQQPASAAAPSAEQMQAFLLENPEVLVQSLQRFEMQERERAQMAQAEADRTLVDDNRDDIFSDGYSLVAGNPEGDITLVEFADYNCGFCKRAHEQVSDFLESDGNVRLVVKEFPILGEGSVAAARAALAAKIIDEEKAYAFSDALMTHRGRLDDEQVMRMARAEGFDVDALAEAMESDEVTEQIARNHALAQKLGISGTPAFVLGDHIERGFVPADRLEELAEAARGSG